MFQKKATKNDRQVVFVTLDELVPRDHLLRKIEDTLDFSFIYPLVEPLYCADNGRPCLDPVVLFKMVFLQILFNIQSMRQTIREIEVNVAYRWFLGLGLQEKVPHFSTFSQNYRRRFQGSDVFDQIFGNILQQILKHGYIDDSMQFIDSTHVKAHANRHKCRKVSAAAARSHYQKRLEEEIEEDRKGHGKKPLKPADKPSDRQEKVSTQSTTDPESGLFHKGQHKEVFAYSVQTSCDSHGWVLAYEAYAGNRHDSQTFFDFYEARLKAFGSKKMVMDAGYKTPAVAKRLHDDGVQPVFPYTRPHRNPRLEKAFSKKNFRYDKDGDRYLCPESQELAYATTNREGYRIYQSQKGACQHCPSLGRCTANAQCRRSLTRHIWQDYLDQCEAYRLTPLGKREYGQRKETIERVFGTVKEQHRFRYTNLRGREKMRMKAALTFACYNMKKFAKMRTEQGDGGPEGRKAPCKKAGLTSALRALAAKFVYSIYLNTKNKPQAVNCLPKLGRKIKSSRIGTQFIFA